MKLDPNNTWKLVEERLESETDPTLRHNLELVLEHMKREAQADIRSSQLQRARDACWKRTLQHTRDEFSLPLARFAHA